VPVEVEESAPKLTGFVSFEAEQPVLTMARER
jgi:hypothetical protein